MPAVTAPRAVTAPLVLDRESASTGAVRLSGRNVAVALILVAIGVGMLGFGGAGNNIVLSALVLTVLGAASVTIARVHGSIAEGLGIGLLMPWFGVVFILTYGLSTLVWLGTPQGSYAEVSRSSIGPAAVLVGIGLSCVMLGYLAGGGLFAGPGVRFGRVLLGRRALPTLTGYWILSAAWGIATYVQIGQGSFGYLQNVRAATTDASPFARLFGIAVTAGPMALALASWASRGKRKGAWKVSLAVGVLAQTGAALLAGGKEGLIVIVLAVLLGRAASIGRVKLVRGAAVLVIIVAVVVPAVTAYRAAVTAGGGRLSPGQVLGNITGIFNQAQTQAQLAKQSGSSPLNSFFWRESRISDVAIIVQRTPDQIPFQSGSAIVEAPILGVVPRIIWPTKPILTEGLQFSHLYYDIPAQVETSSAITPYGDLYIHGGYVTLVLGCLVLGFFISLLDVAGAALRDPRWVFVTLALFTVVMKQEMDYVNMVSTIPFALLGTALFMRMAIFGSPRIEDQPS